MADRGILSSLRYLFADVIGDDEDAPPFLPEGLPEPVMAAASDAIHLLIDYQGLSYAHLYVHRLRRFVGKQRRQHPERVAGRAESMDEHEGGLGSTATVHRRADLVGPWRETAACGRLCCSDARLGGLRLHHLAG